MKGYRYSIVMEKPLLPGTKVRTLSEHGVFVAEARKKRQWGVEGTIQEHHDSHGLFYNIKHSDGTIGPYEPSEFEILELILKI